MEGKHHRKDGSTFPVEVNIGAFEEGGRRLHVALARDITERKRMEDSLRKARDELELRVQERTAELSRANARLQEQMKEIARLKGELERENVYLQEEIKIQHNFEEIVGRGPILQKVLEDIQTVAPTDATVLVTGETGTGKELVVRALHNLSARKKKPLVKVNCAALPASLVESELFGHEKGAFTGALALKIGRFELANGGTIFLDEIGDLPLELQAKLLRVLQEGELERVGGTKTLRVHVRVIAATNRDLEKAVSEQTFRADLYYRLNVFPITMPALRERIDDIPMLAAHFALKYGRKLGKPACEISRDSMAALKSYPWPGNVRELENVIERAMIVSRSEMLELRNWLAASAAQAPNSPSAFATLDDAQRKHILSALERTGWQVGGDRGAAKLLGMKPSTLQARMKKLGIERQRP